MKIDKVLVVDDSKVAHLTLRKMLTERGIEVDWVGSGEDSLTYLKEQKPNLIFMDVMMPGMDGFETTTAIKTSSGPAAPPIIMCSANTTNEDKENAAKLGAVDFLSKPYTSEELDSVLEKVRSLVASLPTSAPAAPAAAGTAALSGSGDVHQAEQAAWATADKVAREVAGDIARTVAENAAREAAEQAGRKSAQAATQAAKAAAEKAVQAASSDIAQQINGEVMNSVNTLIMQKLAEQKIDTPDFGQLRNDVQREVAQQVGTQVEEAIGNALASDSMKQQLTKLVQQKAMPVVEDAARRTATKVSEDSVAEALENTGGVSKLSVVALVLSIAALAAAGFAIMQTL